MYTVTLKGGVGADRILDAAGNALAADYVWSFTTADITAPAVVSTTPANNAINVLTSATITAELTETAGCGLGNRHLGILTERHRTGTGYLKLYAGQHDHHADTIIATV